MWPFSSSDFLLHSSSLGSPTALSDDETQRRRRFRSGKNAELPHRNYTGQARYIVQPFVDCSHPLSLTHAGGGQH